MTIDRSLFKSVLRRWVSGVAIVTTRAGERVAGMTVSSFSAVSLDPPLVMVCASHAALTLPVILEAGDHVILVGQVEAAELAPAREPLVYYDAAYRRLEPAR